MTDVSKEKNRGTGRYLIFIVLGIGLCLCLVAIVAGGVWLFIQNQPAIPASTNAISTSTSMVTPISSATRARSTSTPSKTALSANQGRVFKGLKVGFLQTADNSGGSWRVANTKSYKDFASANGINLTISYANYNLNAQVADFYGFVSSKVDVIILSPVQMDGYSEVLKNAKKAGVPVIVQEGAIDATDDLYVTRVSSDFLEEGRKAAKAMCKLLADSPKKNVVEVAGTAADLASTDRAAGFREAMADCGITITQTQRGNWNQAGGQQAMTDILKASKDIQGVFAQNDEMVFGAIQAIKGAGLVPGKGIKTVSVDGTRSAFNAMIAGDLNVTVECNPMMGELALTAALRILNGETLPKFIPAIDDVFWADSAAAGVATRTY